MKNVLPLWAEPARAVLLRIEGSDNRRGRLAREVLGYIGHEVCVHEGQMITFGIALDTLGKALDASPDDEALRDTKVFGATLAAAISASRIECDSCLNQDCEQRDPEATIPKARRG